MQTFSLLEVEVPRVVLDEQQPELLHELLPQDAAGFIPVAKLLANFFIASSVTTFPFIIPWWRFPEWP